MTPLRLSVLDRSRTRWGRDPGEALRGTVRFAREAEALGYHRFWVSEHHSVPGVAGSAPAVLAAAVAAATSRIRVGTGGVMLPNHRPLVVAEQFGVLESLFPGRIDMGLGRSVGFTDGIRRALGTEKEAMAGFGEQLTELAEWFGGGPPRFPGVHAFPAEGLRVPLFVLANDAGAEVAARAGAALVIGGVTGGEATVAAIGRYRAAFTPSAWRDEPYVVVAGNVAVAGSREAARRLLVPEAWALAHSRTHGAFPPLRPAEEIEALEMTDRERTLYEDALRGHVHGTEEDVAAALAALVRRTAADEVLVTTSSYDTAALLDSYRRLAGVPLPGGTTGTCPTPAPGRRP
ncbi:MsnO8 family LLM class oxidoreductase [Streptomyces griseocarneus]|uniref:MsnO8 family LLM class oxidoreductase n=1 Tax=Streptomyces griseocarneus TaxID=51201 RepID=UPI00167DE45C|nr:MsnO8 family LLM class oxidoreductase [Streptomyces griseocarneus]MBZ6471826.1 MsnO8 family LLM class oxidoreductase [Streptomyces griseocarneus]GHG71067.1 methylene-tetrahydromethanopterin reductase [Streptomyces griseocarneus]